MWVRITAWILYSSVMISAGCTSSPGLAPTSTVSLADTASKRPLITATSSRHELNASPEPVLIQTPSPPPSSSTAPTVSLPWEPVGIFFEEDGSIYHTRFDGSTKQLVIPGERLISVSPDGIWVISSGDSGVHLVSSIGERVALPPANADAYFWSPDSSALILLRNPGKPQGDSEYERWSLTPVGLERQFQIDGELLPLGIDSQGNLLLETLDASDYDPGPLDYTPGYYNYDDRQQQLHQIEIIDLSIQPIAPGGQTQGGALAAR